MKASHFGVILESNMPEMELYIELEFLLFCSEITLSVHFPCGLWSDYVGFIKKVMKQMQHPQYTSMKKMEVDMRPLDAEEEKAQQGQYWLSISDLYSLTDLHFRYHPLSEYNPQGAAMATESATTCWSSMLRWCTCKTYFYSSRATFLT